MKVKVSNFLKFAILSLSIIIVGSCLCVTHKSNSVDYASALSQGTDYSQAVDDAILSVEKVAVLSTGENYEEALTNYSSASYPFAQTLTDGNIGIKQVAVADGNYYYQDIKNGTKDKTVVENNTFVKLNNFSYEVSGETKYYTPNYIAKQNGISVKMAEAIMFSFGTYSYNETQTSLLQNNVGNSLITYVNVVAYRNGTQIELPSFRQYTYEDYTYQDFTYIIPQKTGYDGYYQFEVDYILNGKTSHQSFNFYLLFDTTYSNEVVSGVNHYSTFPTLSTSEGSTSLSGGSFVLGSTEQYPVLTYDYKKFKINITHTSKNATTTYAYNYNTLTKCLDCTITGTNENESVSYPMYQGSNSLVIVMLTEMGEYTIQSEYIYSGYNANIAPTMNETIEDLTLSIQGFELKYSKHNYTEAQMRYIEVANNATDNANGITVILPNAVEYGTTSASDAIGITYKMVVQGTRTGRVISSKDAQIDTYLASINVETLTAKKYLTNNLETDSNFTSVDATALSNILNGLTYQTTNQGSLWLSANFAFDVDKSIYFYRATQFDANYLKDSANALPLQEQTTFSKVGYYFVCVKVNVSASESFYQFFAFKYTAGGLNVKVEKVDSSNANTHVVVGANTYLNQNVIVTWEEPDVFEEDFDVYCYYSVDEFGNDYYNYNKSQLENGQILGQDLLVGNGARYTIEMVGEGDTRSYTTFTIDKQQISGVGVYAVDKNNKSDGSVVYELRTSLSGDTIKLANSVINNYASMMWDDKASGAGITAKYYFTPFVKSTSMDIEQVYQSTSEIWYSTNYVLGSTIGPIKFNKADMGEIAVKNVFQNSGIYLVELVDQAGNNCYFMFVVDATESYFKIGDEFVANSSLIFSGDTTIELSTHKAIEISATGLTGDIIDLAKQSSTASQYATLNYYVGSDGNISSLNSLFNAIGDKVYLKIANSELVVYDNQGSKDSSLCKSTITANSNTINLTYQASDDTSLVRKFYLFSESEKYRDKVSDLQAESFLVIEINPDHSRGLVYYGQDKTTEVDNLTRLYTGANINGAHATNDNYVVFNWQMGTGKYEIDTITYSYYTLSLKSQNFGDLFYYNPSTKIDATIYEGGSLLVSGVVNDSEGRAYINVVNGQTQAGLYVITRTYKGGDSDFEGTNDSKVMNYYFVVDRNGIIDTSNSINGGNISIGLLEQETTFNSFNTIGVTSDRFSYEKDGITNWAYNIYLETNKLPAEINVPVAKYFDGTNASSYYAGKLKFTVYYSDKQSQIRESGIVTKLFTITDVNTTEVKNGYYTLDFSTYLTSALEYEKLLHANNDKDWLCLPGDYIIVVSDMVEGSNAQQVVLGMRILSAENPETDVYSTPSKELTIDDAIYVADNKVLVTSEEYVKVELPEYSVDDTLAQVDINYLLVEVDKNGRREYYINYPYSYQGGSNLNSNSNIVENKNALGEVSATNIASRTIYLETGIVKDSEGNITVDSIDTEITYYVTIRYKLSGDNNVEKYKSCYYYYFNNNEKTYYETTYKITIDRKPPTNNTLALEANDLLVSEYNTQNQTDTMLGYAVYQSSSNVYFVNQYTAYYNNDKDNKYLYAFLVDETTAFDATDIDNVYYKEFENLDLISLEMPKTNFSGYSVVKASTISSYANLLSNTTKFLEILEIDYAGNINQYVVMKKPTTFDASATINLKYIENGVISTNAVELFSRQDITIFDVPNDQTDTLAEANDIFYKMEILNAVTNEKTTILTDATNNFNSNGFIASFANTIRELGQGNYVLMLTSRDSYKTININYYDIAQQERISIENLVEKTGDSYKINLQGANKEKQGIMYYAEKIVVTHAGTSTTYRCYPAENYIYKVENTNDVVTYLNNLSGTYQLTMTDALNNVSTYRFNTQGMEFYSLNFEGGNSYLSSGVYYGFTTATITYDITLYEPQIQYTINGKIQTLTSNAYSYETKQIISVDRELGIIKLYPYFDSSYNGMAYSVTINFKYEDAVEFSYKVCLDTQIGGVILKDTKTNSTQYMDIAVNQEEPTSVPNTTTTSGTMNLSWAVRESDVFSYKYFLYEGFSSGETTVEELTGVTNKVINTTANSTGLYHFEVKVYTADNKYLGNKVYVFSVKAELNDMYYVQNNLTAISNNSSFKFSELGDSYLEYIASALSLSSGELTKTDLPQMELPLYISIDDLTVVVANDRGADKKIYTVTNDGYTLYVYRVYTSTISWYFAILKVPTTSELIYDFKMGVSEDNLTTIEDVTASMFVNANEYGTIYFSQKNVSSTFPLANKNKLALDVLYNDVWVDTINMTTSRGSYTIKGSGLYNFMIKDIAGNVNIFTNEYVETSRFNLSLIKEIPVVVNGAIPIQNAFYNDEVSITLGLNGMTELQVSATKNGRTYAYEKVYYTYTFSEYGTYRVVIKGNYLGHDISRTLLFTIINSNEAKEILDLTGLSGCTIDKVENMQGQDVTTAFNSIFNGQNGKMITYSKLAENADALGVSAGKQSFVITYSLQDKIYPARSLSFEFTMNNEKPTIDCNLELGETTKKGFEIYFNPGIIYEQVGEAYIYINDKLICTIDENSNFGQVSAEIQQKVDGAGDYYVKLVSTSGTVITSFKVEVKEPLNAWAIIIIVVASAIVIGVGVTIFVLRHKMRIR